MSHVAVCSSCDLCVIYRLAHVVSKHTWYSQGRLIAEAGRWSEGSWTQSPGLPSACCPPETQSGPLQMRTAVSRNLYSAGAASCLRRGNTLPVFVCKSFHCLCLSRVQHIAGVSEIIFFSTATSCLVAGVESWHSSLITWLFLTVEHTVQLIMTHTLQTYRLYAKQCDIWWVSTIHSLFTELKSWKHTST